MQVKDWASGATWADLLALGRFAITLFLFILDGNFIEEKIRNKET